MSRAEEHGWYKKPEDWTPEQLEDYHRFHGFERREPEQACEPAQLDATWSRQR
jgi:hypothetical protein